MSPTISSRIFARQRPRKTVASSYQTDLLAAPGNTDNVTFRGKSHPHGGYSRSRAAGTVASLDLEEKVCGISPRSMPLGEVSML